MLDEKRITGDHLGPYLRNVDVQWGRINVADLPEMDFRDDDLGRFSLLPGDLLVCEGGEVGRAAVWNGEIEPCFYQKALHRLRPYRPRIDCPGFLFYAMVAAAKLGVFSGSEGKATIIHLPAETFRGYRFAFPPIDEQSAIAVFLDRETARIDALVEEQHRLIALLKEKRQAVISHAVTKGLDPNAPMKDSGVEWLGEVPAHWQVLSLARVTTAKCDGPFGSGLKSEHYTDEGVRVIRLQNIRASGFDGTDAAFIGESYYRDELGGHDVLSGDVLIAGLGDERNTVGRACVAPSGIEPAMVKADCFRFRVNSSTALPKFVATELTAGSAFDAGILSSGSTRSRIPLSVMATRKLALPPLSEQSVILEFLEGETRKIDLLLDEANSGIVLLKERRNALISAAVTGEIDVRGLAPIEAEAA
jgi:type I restriction enzyme S subunit